MKKLSLFLLFLLLPVWCWGGTYYVANAGNDACNGTSGAIGTSGNCAWKTIGFANDNMWGSDGLKLKRGDTFTDARIYVQAGVWNTGGTIEAYYNADGSDDTTRAKPIVGPVANRSILINGVADITVKNLEIRAGDTEFALAANANGAQIYNNVFSNPAGKNGGLLQAEGTGISVHNNEFIDGSDANEGTMCIYLLEADFDTSIDYYLNIHKGFKPDTLTSMNDYMVISGAAGNEIAVNLYNNVFEGMPESILRINTGATSTVAVTAKNNIFGSHGVNGSNTEGIRLSGTGTPTLDIDYNLVLPPLEKPTSVAALGAGITQSHPANYQVNPRYRSPRYGGIILLTWDDSTYLAEHVNDALPVLSAYGVHGTFCYPQSWLQDSMDGPMNAAKKTLVQSLLSAGNDICSHSYSHSTLTMTNAIDLTAAGCTSPTVTVANTQTGVSSTWTGAISVNATEFASPHTFTTTGKTITQAIAGIAHTEGGCAISAAISATNPIDGAAKATSLANITGQSIPRTLAVDQTKFLQSEMDDTRIWFDAQLGVTTTSFSAPGNTWDAAVSTSLAASSFKAARRNGVAAETTKPLSSANIHTIYIQDISEIANATEATMRTNAAALAMGVAQNGLIYALNMHSTTSTDPGTVVSAAQLGWMIDEFKKAGVTVLSMAELAPYLNANGWATADDITFTKTLTDISDYRLRSGSPAINAGVDVGLTTDFLGKPIRGVPDIGAYEFQPTGGGLGMGIIYGF